MMTKFPAEQYTYYSQMVVEGYERPSFFTQLKPISMEPVNYNSRKNHVTFYIDYMQEIADEVDALEVIMKIMDLFGTDVRVGDRSVDVTGFDYEFIGSKRNIPEMTIDSDNQ